jgi:hypothetical protein
VALLLEEKPALGPPAVKMVLQVTSAPVQSAERFSSGTGSLNVLAAAEFVGHDFQSIPPTEVAGERVAPSGRFFAQPSARQLIAWSDATGSLRPDGAESLWTDGAGSLWGDGAESLPGDGALSQREGR